MKLVGLYAEATIMVAQWPVMGITIEVKKLAAYVSFSLILGYMKLRGSQA